jgi:hypothetical protein
LVTPICDANNGVAIQKASSPKLIFCARGIGHFFESPAADFLREEG